MSKKILTLQLVLIGLGLSLGNIGHQYISNSPDYALAISRLIDQWIVLVIVWILLVFRCEA